MLTGGGSGDTCPLGNIQGVFGGKKSYILTQKTLTDYLKRAYNSNNNNNNNR